MITQANHPGLTISYYADAVRARARGEADLAWAMEERAFGMLHTTPIDHACRGLARLRHGFFDGWLSYEWRWADPRHRAHHARPFMQTHEPWHRFACDANGNWTERPGWERELAALTILVGQEGGAGDMIMLSRFLPWLARRAKHVYWLVPLDMLRLREAVDFHVNVIAQEELPAFDRYVMMFSLPAIVGEMVPPDPGFHIYGDRSQATATGLCWAGSPLYANNLPLYGNTDIRSMDETWARRFLPAITEARNGGVLCYQRGTEALRWPKALSHELRVTGDWFDTYQSLATECRRVVTVDTGLAHLAGAMGLETHTMLAKDHCWRWGGEQSRTLWYPSMRLYTQQTPGDWSYAIAEVVRQLKAEG